MLWSKNEFFLGQPHRDNLRPLPLRRSSAKKQEEAQLRPKKPESAAVTRKVAVGEQLRSGFPIPEEGTNEKKLRNHQVTLFTPRGRRTEDIIVGMIDQIRKTENGKQEQPLKKNRRKRRCRRPKVYYVRYSENQTPCWHDSK
jgi:hypothetical protein